MEDGYAELRRAWDFYALDGYGCPDDPLRHHHHEEREKHGPYTGPASQPGECPALCNDRCGRGPGSLAAVTGERCLEHHGNDCGGSTASDLGPVVPCPRYTPGLRDLAKRLGDFSHNAAGLAIVAEGVLLWDDSARVWKTTAEAPPWLLRERSKTLRAFLVAAIAAYEARAAGEAAAVTEARYQTRVTGGELIDTLKRFRPQV